MCVIALPLAGSRHLRLATKQTKLLVEQQQCCLPGAFLWAYGESNTGPPPCHGGALTN